MRLHGLQEQRGDVVYEVIYMVSVLQAHASRRAPPNTGHLEGGQRASQVKRESQSHARSSPTREFHNPSPHPSWSDEASLLGASGTVGSSLHCSSRMHQVPTLPSIEIQIPSTIFVDLLCGYLSLT